MKTIPLIYRGWEIFIYVNPDAVHATKGKTMSVRLRHHLRAHTEAEMRRLIDAAEALEKS